MKKILTNIGIIGAGPAGISCAIQLRRFGFKTIIFEKESIGGMLSNASLIENYPGFPKGIRGADMCRLLEKQAKHFELDIRNEEVSGVVYKDNSFLIQTQASHLQCDRLVIASGTKPREISGIRFEPDTEEFIFRDLLYLKNIEGKKIGIIGAGDAAFDYAVSLSDKNYIHILNRGDKIKAIPTLVHKIDSIENINYHNHFQILKVERTGNHLQVHTSKSKHIFDYLLFAIGRIPETAFLSTEISKDQDKLIEQKKLFFIGDVINENKRQLAIAAGNGVECAMQINEIENGSH